MNLIVDIGNTTAKVAVVDRGEILHTLRVDGFEDIPFDKLLTGYDIDNAIVCSTRGNAAEASHAVAAKVGRCLLFDSTVAVPLKNNYATPKTLGLDRMAAAVGAYELYSKSGEDLLVIDFGTAITIDHVSSEGVFEGGFISPGVRCRLRSLNDYTASLPLCEPSEEVLPMATSTKEAIVHGVMNGITYEIEGYIERFLKKKCKLSIIFSGGDAFYFDKRIKNTIFANQELVIIGLNRILEYNAKI